MTRDVDEARLARELEAAASQRIGADVTARRGYSTRNLRKLTQAVATAARDVVGHGHANRRCDCDDVTESVLDATFSFGRPIAGDDGALLYALTDDVLDLVMREIAAATGVEIADPRGFGRPLSPSDVRRLYFTS